MYLYIYHKIQPNVDEYHTWVVWVDIPVRQSTTAIFHPWEPPGLCSAAGESIGCPFVQVFSTIRGGFSSRILFQVKDYLPKTHTKKCLISFNDIIRLIRHFRPGIIY